MNIAMMLLFLDIKLNHWKSNHEMHCFASENQTYTGTVIFGVESLKSVKGQENLLLKNLQLKTRVENVRFLSWRTFFVGKSVFKAPTKWLLKGL